ncbi:hypothetical protein HK096_007715, partial [Nowakowskiella sp. JEL0078]
MEDEILPYKSASNIGFWHQSNTETISILDVTPYNATTIVISGIFFDKPANQKESAQNKEKIQCKL